LGIGDWGLGIGDWGVGGGAPPPTPQPPTPTPKTPNKKKFLKIFLWSLLNNILIIIN